MRPQGLKKPADRISTSSWKPYELIWEVVQQSLTFCSARARDLSSGATLTDPQGLVWTPHGVSILIEWQTQIYFWEIKSLDLILSLYSFVKHFAQWAQTLSHWGNIPPPLTKRLLPSKNYIFGLFQKCTFLVFSSPHPPPPHKKREKKSWLQRSRLL